jgi:hypothetical protein
MNQQYIHFTSKKHALEIKESGVLWASSFVEGVFAVAKGGSNSPKVQQTKLGRTSERDFAIYFTTDELPDYCYPEECIWKQPLIAIDIIKITKTADAVNDLNSSLEILNYDSWNERLLIPTKEMPDPTNPPDFLLSEDVQKTRKSFGNLSESLKIVLIERGSFKRIVLVNEEKLHNYFSSDAIEEDLGIGMKKETPVIGSVVFQKAPKFNLWTTISIASEKGYGPFLYELAMSTVNPSWYAPDDISRVSSQAKNVWDKFCNRDDIEKKIKETLEKSFLEKNHPAITSIPDCEYSLFYQYRMKSPLSYSQYILSKSTAVELGYQPKEFEELISDLASEFFLEKYDLPD